MNLTRSTLLILITIITFSISCEKKASEEIDFGSVVNSVYTNQYLGLTVTMPSQWSVQDEQAKKELMKLGGELMAGDNENLKQALKASEMTTVNLFIAFQHPVGTPIPFNPNIVCMAERVRHAPGIKNGKDYLLHSKKTMETSQMSFTFPSEIYYDTIAGRQFAVLNAEMAINGTTVKQQYYTTIIKGYALSFITSFTNDEHKAALKNILNSATIK